jgi:hypothetical protein
MPRGGSVVGFRTVGYEGPGDIVSGARFWWGLRAYDEASIGANAVRLRRDSDSLEQDFVTFAGGGLDLTSISSFKGAANLFVTKLYDQSGTANHMLQATTALQPALLLATLGTLPVMRFDGGAGQRFGATSAETNSQPITVSSVYKRDFNTSSFQNVFCSGPGQAFLVGPSNNNNQALQSWDNGSTLQNAIGATEGSFHAVQWIGNGGSSNSNINVDGTSNPVSSGTNGFNGDIPNIAHSVSTFDGDMLEVGVWLSAFSSGQCSSMNTNQSTYWGY